MKYSESLKKNRDFQLVYKQGNIVCKPISGHVCEEKSAGTEPDWNFSK